MNINLTEEEFISLWNDYNITLQELSKRTGLTLYMLKRTSEKLGLTKNRRRSSLKMELEE